MGEKLRPEGVSVCRIVATILAQLPRTRREKKGREFECEGESKSFTPNLKKPEIESSAKKNSPPIMAKMVDLKKGKHEQGFPMNLSSIISLVQAHLPVDPEDKNKRKTQFTFCPSLHLKPPPPKREEQRHEKERTFCVQQKFLPM